ncbi:LytTR family DNA-binding domain-containing protein [Sphingobacterium sp.]|uniref:LytR/AlgR family response regulator transcription factor n=1 Tax=Sphingobacterium sp. TaxID=341027 RepID=UPI0028A6A52E|nr:LytTR family DNA-binding domain-containing protein [Sphingobacterium sp.]
MKQWSVIIVDDQQASIDRLLEWLEVLPSVNILSTFTDPIRALTFLRFNQVDLVILDIQMENMDGFGFMSAMPKKKSKVILYTAFPEFEDRGYQRNVVDVLLKPVSQTRLLIALDRLDTEMRLNSPELDDRHSLDHYDAYFNVKGPTRYMRKLVRFKDIIYITSSNRYVFIYCNDGNDPLVSNSLLKDIRDMLPRKWFIQCAKGYIFNSMYFNSYRNNKVKLNHVEQEIPVGNKSLYKDFWDLIQRNVI